ncbi:MAG: transglutaminase-like domain-containing protein [Acidobacteriota bacterium]
MAAAIGTLAGAVSGDLAARTRLRTAIGAVGSVGLAAAGIVASRALVTVKLFSSLVGSVPCMAMADVVFWGTLPLAAFFALRMGAARHRTLAFVEVGVAAAALAGAFAGHRQGMVHRPLALANWALGNGIDPVVILIVLGGSGSFVLAALLISEDRKRRLPLHYLALLLLTVGLLLTLRVTGLPAPRPSSDLGLTKPPAGKDSSQSGEPDLAFKDEYKSRGGDAPVAVVLLHDDYEPPSGIYYLRQAACSQWNGRRLSEAKRDGIDEDIPRTFPSAPTAIASAPPVSEQRQELDTTIGLLADHVRPFALDAPARLAPVPNPDPLKFKLAYAATSRVLTLPYDKMLGRASSPPSMTRDQLALYTEIPDDGRYGELARSTLDALDPSYRDDPLAQAFAVKIWLEKNGTYSRKSKHASAEDPAADFLFGDRIGYCVHFAHAATYMMRSLGIPARVGVGYAIDARNRAGGSTLMIRGKDAHAWPEVFVEGVGWVVVDIFPQKSLDPPSDEVDQGLQRALGQMMRRTPEEKQAAQKKPPVRLPPPRTVLLPAAFTLVALLVLAYAIKTHRALIPRFARAPHLYRVGYRAALDRLAEVGYSRRRGESRESLASRSGAIAPSFGPLTSWHLEGALGAPQVDPPDELRVLDRRVAREVRGNVPAWRWILGLLNPVSWLWAR